LSFNSILLLFGNAIQDLREPNSNSLLSQTVKILLPLSTTLFFVGAFLKFCGKVSEFFVFSKHQNARRFSVLCPQQLNTLSGDAHSILYPLCQATPFHDGRDNDGPFAKM